MCRSCGDQPWSRGRACEKVEQGQSGHGVRLARVGIQVQLRQRPGVAIVSVVDATTRREFFNAGAAAVLDEASDCSVLLAHLLGTTPS